MSDHEQKQPEQQNRREDCPYHGFGTVVVHAGQDPDPITGAVVPPISLATTFAQKSPGQLSALDSPYSRGVGFEYSRTGNPTRGAFELAVAAAEHGKHCIAFSSGMAATGSLLQMLESGDHIISIDDVYGGTQRYFRRVLQPHANISTSFVDVNNEEELAAAFQENTKLLWVETPTNPTLKLADIARLAEIAHERNVLLVVDNTFMSPYSQNPLDLGADLVVHSVTKYIGGHSDVVMGVVVTSSDELNEKMRFIQNGLGAVPAPFDCYMALRGLRTLYVRQEAAARSAMQIATFLEEHPMVTKVLYPGLPSHPQHELATRQQHTYGAMVTFYIDGELSDSSTFLSSLKLFMLAESLGSVESLAECPAIMTHASVPTEQREKLGISDTLVRLSVGIECVYDLMDDLENAFAQVRESRK
jgi:cystathionine gamma-lyase